jgi:glycosyltransferase involved in cell wall biosynthesis
MKIAVDGYEIVTPMGGVGRITAGLLSVLAELDPDGEFGLFVRRPTGLSFPANVRERILSPDRGYFRWQNFSLRKALRDFHPDVLLAPNYTLPVFYGRPAVLFEHDISYVSHPEWYSRRERMKTGRLLPHSLKRAAAVITESEFSRQEILAHFPFVGADRITVIHPGLEERFRRSRPEEISGWRARKGLEGKKVVGFLGSIFNRRHIPELVEAVRHTRDHDSDVFLYIVGRDRTSPTQDIAGITAEDWILWEEGLGDEDLPLFYSGCDTFCYLSDYEGFGIPPLEALACGTVPLVLNRTSLAEIYSGMSVLVERPDPEDIRLGLETALSDAAKKASVLAAFEERRPGFSWQLAGEKLFRIIRQTVGAGRI